MGRYASFSHDLTTWASTIAEDLARLFVGVANGVSANEPWFHAAVSAIANDPRCSPKLAPRGSFSALGLVADEDVKRYEAGHRRVAKELFAKYGADRTPFAKTTIGAVARAARLLDDRARR